MNRLVHSAAALLLALFCAAGCFGQASAGTRVALVIGNSAYENAPALANPVRDALAMSGRLKQAGFDIVSVHMDLGNLPFKRALRQFEQAAATADIAVVFYAGHGIEVRGTNYMIPVDARLANDRDAEDEAITLERLLHSVEGAKRLGLIILDACRDNPFLRKMTRTAAVRAATIGLGMVEPTARNTLVAYAAKMGLVAEDGIGGNSPFTTALLNHLFVPGLDIRLALGRVRDEVLKTTSQRQEPFVAGSLGGDLIAVVPRPDEVMKGADFASQRNDYVLVEKIGTRRAWEAFLVQYPSGFYSDLARQQLGKLNTGTLEPGFPPAQKGQEATIGPTPPRPDPPSPPRPTGEEQRAWDRIKDSTDTAVLRDFIKRYPSSVLVSAAEARLEAVERARQEREEKARAEREAKTAEAARQKEAQETVKRAEAERQAKAAEAARQKAEAVARQAEEERRAKVNGEAERRQAALEAVAGRGADEQRVAKLAEAARERQAAVCMNEEKLIASLEIADDLGRAREEVRRLEYDLICERLRPRLLATLKNVSTAEEDRWSRLAQAARARQEADCKREEELIASSRTAANRSKAREDLKRLEYDLVCERLRPTLQTVLEKMRSE